MILTSADKVFVSLFPSDAVETRLEIDGDDNSGTHLRLYSRVPAGKRKVWVTPYVYIPPQETDYIHPELLISGDLFLSYSQLMMNSFSLNEFESDSSDSYKIRWVGLPNTSVGGSVCMSGNTGVIISLRKFYTLCMSQSFNDYGFSDMDTLKKEVSNISLRRERLISMRTKQLSGESSEDFVEKLEAYKNHYVGSSPRTFKPGWSWEKANGLVVVEQDHPKFPELKEIWAVNKFYRYTGHIHAIIAWAIETKNTWVCWQPGKPSVTIPKSDICYNVEIPK